MRPLILQSKHKLSYRLDMSFLSDCNKLKSLTELKNKKIIYGSKEIMLKELFNISGSNMQNIIIKKASSLMDNIGKNTEDLSIKVYGNVGYAFGAHMVNGELTLYGNTLDYTASGLKGGNIMIFGSVGKYFCGKPNTSNEGIKDGLVYVKGNVGDNSIQRMRRGVIVIEGNIGDYACDEMISGTVIIKGIAGKFFGKNIKRGTLFVKDKKLTKNYIKSNNAKYNFIDFYLKNLFEIIGRKIIKNNSLIRFYGNKDINNMSEVFLIKN